MICSQPDMTVIYTNCPDKVVSSDVCHISISDHSLVYGYRKVVFNEKHGSHKTTTYSNFKHFDRNDIVSQNWCSINECSDPNKMWLKWKVMFLTVAETHVPLRTRRIRTRCSPWITADLKQLIRNRNITKIKAMKSNNNDDRLNFKKQRNFVNRQWMVTIILLQ